VSERQTTSEVTFDGALSLSCRRLFVLTCAIGTARYIDARLAAVQLHVALDRAHCLALLMPDSTKPYVVRRLREVRAIAALMLALVAPPPRLRRSEVCQRHSTVAHNAAKARCARAEIFAA
jgi:hypothetical protein